jgi:hypothetical protein
LLGSVQALGLRVPVSEVMARQPMPKALSSLPSVQRSYTSELSVVNAFTFTLFLSEGRAGEAWEPSYKMMLFPLPTVKCLSLLPGRFTFIYSSTFYLSLCEPSCCRVEEFGVVFGEEGSCWRVVGLEFLSWRLSEFVSKERKEGNLEFAG